MRQFCGGSIKATRQRGTFVEAVLRQPNKRQSCGDSVIALRHTGNAADALLGLLDNEPIMRRQ